MQHWYAVQTKARSENLAQMHLNRQGYVTHLPLLRNARHRRGRWCSTIEPLFPGYLFVQLDMATQNSAPIRSTRGVVGLVRFGNEMRPMPRRLMQSLLDAQLEQVAIDPSDLFSEGDRVILVDGPMKGLAAIVQAKQGRDRVLLLLDLLGRENRVVVSPHQLAPVY